MRTSFVLAILLVSLISPCSVLAQEERVGAVEVGESLIHPASPLYFLKAIRENIEAIFDQTPEAKVMRQVEFAQRRLREVKSLVRVKNQELIPSTLEKYKLSLQIAQDLSSRDGDLQIKVGEALSRHLDVLQRVYDQVGNPRAKIAIRAAIESAEEQNRMILSRLDNEKKSIFKSKVDARQKGACSFLERESTASGLTETEKDYLKKRVQICKKEASSSVEIR